MHKQKIEAIAEARKRCADTIRRIRKVTDALFDLGFSYHISSGYECGVSLHKNVANLSDMNAILHQARRITPFDLDAYFIPYDGCVVIHYLAKLIPTKLVFSIDTKDEESIIKAISSGKCRISMSESKCVVCDINR